MKIEVKGLSGPDIGFELTPNEYKKMKTLPKEQYRICVLTSALSEELALYHFSYDSEINMLVEIYTKAQLRVQERTGARISDRMT